VTEKWKTLQTGGSALGDTSTKSNPASSAIFSASAVLNTTSHEIF
jgi:hypothetical protein